MQIRKLKQTAYLSIIMQNDIKKAQIVAPSDTLKISCAYMNFIIKIKKVNITHAHWCKCRAVKGCVPHINFCSIVRSSLACSLPALFFSLLEYQLSSLVLAIPYFCYSLTLMVKIKHRSSILKI